MTLQSTKKRGLSANKVPAGLVSWSFAAPAALLLLIFLIVPFFMAFWLSFTDQRLISNPNLPTAFVGLRNYIRLFADASFQRAILNNFYFAIVVVPLQTAFALGLALLINKRLRGINVFRTIFFSPVVIIMTVVAIVWALLYNPGQGFINQFLKTISFGRIPPLRWLNDIHLALPSIMLLSIWQGVGFQMIIFLAGLQDIPNELYEAANMDGVTPWQSFWYVTLPSLKNTTVFVVITTTILAFKLFDQVYVLTNGTGGPQNSTLTTILFIYRKGFTEQQVGYASAVAVLFFLIVLVISLLQRLVISSDKGGK